MTGSAWSGVSRRVGGKRWTAFWRRLDAGGQDRPGWNGFRRLVAESDMNDRGQRTVVVDTARDLQVLSPYMTRTLRADVDEDRPTREAITRIVEIQPRREVVLREGL